MRILSTKQLDASIVDHAHQMGIELLCVDVIQIRDLDFDVSALMSVIYDALVFTSSNAVRSFFENENIEASDWTTPVYAISGKTTDELKKHGHTPIGTATDAASLADVITANEKIRSVLHICGNLTLDILPDKLMAAGVGHTSLVVYETLPLSKKIDGQYDAIMFYSPSGVDSFVMNNELSHDTLYCCIGETTAAKLKSVNDRIDIILPKQPTPEAMLSAIMSFKKIK